MSNPNVGMNNDPVKQKGMFRFLGAIEKVGNKLPDPFMLFVYLAIFIILLSWLISAFGGNGYSSRDKGRAAY